MKKKRPKIPPKELRELWAQIPDMKNCLGACERSCGPIGCSSMEKKLMEDRAGHKLGTTGKDAAERCNMLVNGLCSVYSIRPSICRLWGVVPSLRCPYGCIPERELTDREGYGIMAEAMALAGDADGHDMQELIRAATPEFWQKLKEHAGGAPDLGGSIVASRRPAAKALYEAAAEIRNRVVD